MSFVLEPSSDGVDLVVTGDWSDDAEQALLDGRADGVVLNYARGFREQPIDFLRGLPIRKLDLLARSVGDLDPVYSLAASLEELRVQSDPKAVIQLERLPRLLTLSAAWPQVVGSINFAKGLQSLSVPAYSEPDLSPLAQLTSLTRLVMKERPKLTSLDGLEALPSLAHLGVHMARNLVDIGGLGRSASPLLKTLQLPSCKQVSDISAVAACSSLQFFEISESGEIATVAPLGDLELLEDLYLFGSTSVADRDLRPIMGLPRLSDFRMKNRRDYSPSVDEIKAVIASRA